jgi:hypothetical protein
MASSPRPCVQAFVPPTERPVVRKGDSHEKRSEDAQKAKRELLADLMSDAKKHLANKNKAERRAIILGIGKIANS